MKVAKEYRWEMGHRLPFHDGGCRNLHGHSYRMEIELEGGRDENGMVIDYYEVDKIIEPIIEELDHAFMVNINDKELLDTLKKLDSRRVEVEFDSTAENICSYFLEKIRDSDLPGSITKIKVTVAEMENSYAQDEMNLT